MENRGFQRKNKSFERLTFYKIIDYLLCCWYKFAWTISPLVVHKRKGLKIMTLPNVAYFSMEIAMDQSLKTYSGGLGFWQVHTCYLPVIANAYGRCNYVMVIWLL